MRNAVVLLSGGLDSATVLAMAREQSYATHALIVDYGQRHRTEIEAAIKVASMLGASEHRTVRVDLTAFGGSALTADIDIPKDRAETEIAEHIPVTYVPARNTILLSLALAYAEVRDAEDIFVGVNAVDYSGYPDCRPEFIRAFEVLANVATKAGVEGRLMRIQAPLIAMTKPEIITEGLRLGVDYSVTRSCYDPDPQGRACGRCDSCQIRRAAFAALELSDPAPYFGTP